MLTNVTLSVGCSGTWAWGGQNLYDVGFANGEIFGVMVRSVKLEVDGIPGLIKSITDVYGVMQPSGGQDLDLSIPLPYDPPNPTVGQSYSLVCKTTAEVTRMDGTDLTVLSGSCMCTVNHKPV